VYRGILHKIVELKYDVFNHRAHVSMGEKARSLPRVWWQARRMRNQTTQ
jgi:phytoene/squalene synthetase